MPKNSVPIDTRLEIAAQLVVRARIFYDIWRYFEGEETRVIIIDTMREYNEFFRFAPHAHFLAFIIQAASLLETRDDTVNLHGLARELMESGTISTQDTSEVSALLSRVKPLASKIAILRNNVFGHRNSNLSYSQTFEKAAVTPNELCDLTDLMLTFVNRLLTMRNLSTHAFTALPVSDAERMMKALLQRSLPKQGSQ